MANPSNKEVEPFLLDDDLLMNREEKGQEKIDVYNKTTSQEGLPPTRMEVGLYMFTFFAAMLGHELALEAATTEFSSLHSIAYSVTLFQFGFCLFLPLIASKCQAVEKFPRTFSELKPYIGLTAVVFGATALATASLKWVTYPTKVVFKASKLIPTMAVATVLQGKRYNALDYMAALLLCAGAAGYAMDAGNIKNNDDKSDSLPGLVLLLISILCDAFVPNLQQQFMTPPNALSASELMVNVNAVGFVGLLVYMVIVGQLWEGIQTCLEFPRLILYLSLVGVGLSTAVLAYTKLIKASGSVVAVAVATLRKVATVVLSYVFFPKPLTTIHILSGVAVLAGLILSSMNKQRQTS